MSESSNTGTVQKRKPGRPKGSKCKNGYKMTEKALSQRKEATPWNGVTQIANTPEALDYNTRLINHIMQISEIAATADHNDVNSLKACFISYLKLCQINGFPVQNLAAYSAMGFPTAAHFAYYCKQDDPEKRALAASVKSVCAMFRETMVTEGKINPVIGIFWQRNYDGLRNDTEQIQNINEQEDNDTSNKSYKEKYKNLIGE